MPDGAVVRRWYDIGQADPKRDRLPLARLDTHVAYVIGTGQNHSERQGPFAEWRGRLTTMVRSRGRRLDVATAAMFGQDLALIRSLA